MIALLPMKGHSERVPGKNIKLLNGKPLFFYIADTLKLTGLFKNLVINTDSSEIADLAKSRYTDWVKIIIRPEHLLGDDVPMNLIIKHDLSILQDDSIYFQTHSTNPLLTSQTIEKAISKFIKGRKNNGIESLFSTTLLKTRLYDKNIKPLNHDPLILQRTQDLEGIYEENSNFYIFTKQSFEKCNHRIGLDSDMFVMKRNAFESLDIDDLSDWDLVEQIVTSKKLDV